MPEFAFNANDLQRLNRLLFTSSGASLEAEAGRHRSRRRGDGVDFLDYRQYVAGDEVRKIDWPLYARMRQVFIRLNESPRQLGVHLLVDVSQSMMFDQPVTKLEQAQRLACAMAFIALRGGDRLYITPFSDQVQQPLGPLSGVRAMPAVISYLRRCKGGGTSGLKQAIDRLHAMRRSRGMIIVLSDFLNVPDSQSALQSVLAGGGRVTAFQVLDQLDRGHGLAGTMRLRDSETGAGVDVHVDEKVLAAYQEKFEASRLQFEEFLNRRGQAYLYSPTDRPYLELVCNALRATKAVK